MTDREAITVTITPGIGGWHVSAHRRDTGEMRELTTPRPLSPWVSVASSGNTYKSLAGALRAIGSRIDDGSI